MHAIGNPEFLRLVRSKLSTRQLVMYGFAAALIFSGVLALYYFIEKQNMAMRRAPFLLSRLLYNYFFIVSGIQLAIVSIYGVALSAQNVTLEKERGTFDFQRLVAMGPWRLTIGKILGAPVEANFMALVGVPFAIVSCIGGGVPLLVLLQIQVVVFVFALVVGAFGVMCSSLVDKSAHATGIVMVLGVPLSVLAGAWSSTSLYSTSSPVFIMRELYAPDYEFMSVMFQFFSFRIPVIVGFLLSNSLLILLFATITARRFADAELSFMTPRQGLLTFVILQIYMLTCIVSEGSSDPYWELPIFHGTNLFALILLAFALTPGAELVRGRVFRSKRNEHWRIVLERDNPLQDSPALRVMFELCGIYVGVSALFTILTRSPQYPQMPFIAGRLTLMVAAIGIATTALLLYIQVYTSRGCFRIGAALIFAAFFVPPMLMYLGALMPGSWVKPENIFLVSPIAYVFGLKEMDPSTDFACPLISAILAGALCFLAALRIRFLLDVDDIIRKRAPVPRGRSLQDRMASPGIQNPSANKSAGATPNPDA